MMTNDTLQPAVHPLELTSEERPWGMFTVIQDADYCKLKHLMLRPGQRLSLQYHHHREEHWMVTRGVGLVTVGDKQWEVKAGTYINIPKLAQHRLENISANEPLEWLEVQLGESFDESDIVRLQDDYKRA